MACRRKRCDILDWDTADRRATSHIKTVSNIAHSSPKYHNSKDKQIRIVQPVLNTKMTRRSISWRENCSDVLVCTLFVVMAGLYLAHSFCGSIWSWNVISMKLKEFGVVLTVSAVHWHVCKNCWCIHFLARRDSQATCWWFMGAIFPFKVLSQRKNILQWRFYVYTLRTWVHYTFVVFAVHALLSKNSFSIIS